VYMEHALLPDHLSFCLSHRWITMIIIIIISGHQLV